MDTMHKYKGSHHEDTGGGHNPSVHPYADSANHTHCTKRQNSRCRKDVDI